MDKKITVLSLFDGMAGARIALDKLGIECDYYASEVDKWAKKIAQKNYPDIIQLGDIQKLSYEDGVLSSEAGEFDVGEIDLVIGGSPCQGFSTAGGGLNFDDPRSKLYFEFERLVEQTSSRYFLLENVNMKKEWRDVISDRMGVKPIKINSKRVSPSLRSRLYWTNIKGVTLPPERGNNLQSILESGVVDREKSYCIDANYSKTGNLKRYFERHSRQLVFEIDKDAPEYFRSPSKNDDGFEWVVRRGVDEGYISYRILSPLETERAMTVPEGYTEGVSKSQRYKMLGNGFTIGVIAHILSFANFYP